MEVWVVTYDAYGDHGVVFVASTEEKALEFSQGDWDYRVERFVVDERPT